MISNVVLTFMHSWFQGNNHQEIIKLSLSSFSNLQLADAAKALYEKFPATGKFVAHRDTAGRSASEMYSTDILKAFGVLDNKAVNVVFTCDSISMSSVKLCTMLFSDEEPVLAHKMALVEKTLSELIEGQKTLFTMMEKQA